MHKKSDAITTGVAPHEFLRREGELFSIIYTQPYNGWFQNIHFFLMA